MSKFLELIFSTDFFYSILRVTTPILLAALGSVIASSAGICNLALEGTMTLSALAGVVISAWTQNVWLGLLAAVAAGAVFTALLSFFVLKMEANDAVAGIAMNIMATGLASFLLFQATGEKGVSTSLESLSLPRVNIPLIQEIPVLGKIISGHNIMTYLAFFLVFVVFVFLYQTKLGTRIRAAGLDDDTARSAGVPVFRTKFAAVMLSGVFASLAGAYMSMAYLNTFATNMVAGRGYIALAAEAMGGTKPLGTMAASLIFGIFDAISNMAQSLRIPSELIQCIPYTATIIGLVAYSVRRQQRLKKRLLGKGPKAS